MIDRESTRSRAKPPIRSKGAIHSAAMMIIRRVSEPVRRRCALVGAASRRVNLGRRRYRGGWLVQLAGSSRL